MYEVRITTNNKVNLISGKSGISEALDLVFTEFRKRWYNKDADFTINNSWKKSLYKAHKFKYVHVWSMRKGDELTICEIIKE